MPEQRRILERLAQHPAGQGAARVLRDRREAEMPGFGLHAGQYTAERPEKAEAGSIVLQPVRRARPNGPSAANSAAVSCTRYPGATAFRSMRSTSVPQWCRLAPGSADQRKNRRDAFRAASAAAASSVRPIGIVERPLAAEFRRSRSPVGARNRENCSRGTRSKPSAARRPAQIQERRHDRTRATHKADRTRRRCACGRVPVSSAVVTAPLRAPRRTRPPGRGRGRACPRSWAPDRVYWPSKMKVGTPVIPSAAA